MQSKDEHHEMRHAESFSRYDMFVCDVCGREMLLHREPGAMGPGEQPVIVLERGDSRVSHSGGMGGAAIDSVTTTVDQDAELFEEQVELSEEWKTWLTEILDDMPDISQD
jgi:hypothetical protein